MHLLITLLTILAGCYVVAITIGLIAVVVWGALLFRAFLRSGR